MPTDELLVVGDAMCVWDDLKPFIEKRTITAPGHIMTVHRIGIHFPGKIEHWYGNNGDDVTKMAAARDARFEKEYPFSGNTHAATGNAKYIWDNLGPGTSGLNAVKVGLRLGYQKITVAGMPLDDTPHNGEPPWLASNLTRECRAYRKDHNGIPPVWRDAIENIFQGRVTSLSGNSRKWIEELNGP